jgi:hypothetical protein
MQNFTNDFYTILPRYSMQIKKAATGSLMVKASAATASHSAALAGIPGRTAGGSTKR